MDDMEMTPSRAVSRLKRKGSKTEMDPAISSSVSKRSKQMIDKSTDKDSLGEAGAADEGGGSLTGRVVGEGLTGPSASGSDVAGLSRLRHSKIGGKERSKVMSKALETKSVRQAKVEDYIFPPSTIIKLLKQQKMYQATKLNASTFLRVIDLVGKGNMPVYEVEMVRLVEGEKTGHKGNKVLVKVEDEPTLALKVQCFSSRSATQLDLLQIELDKSSAVFMDADSAEIEAPHVRMKLKGDLAYADQATVEREGGSSGWVTGTYKAIVMELGLPLSAVLKSPITDQRRALLFTKAFKVIKALHSLNWTHRDVKWDNFVLCYKYSASGERELTDDVKLIDMASAEKANVPWLDDSTGLMNLNVLGTTPYWTSDVFSWYFAECLEEAEKLGRLEGKWTVLEISKMKGRLEGASFEFTTKGTDYWALAISMIRELDPVYFKRVGLPEWKVDELRSMLIDADEEMVPSAKAFARKLGAICRDHFVPLTDRRSYLSSAKVKRGAVRGTIDEMVFGDILEELLQRPLSDSPSTGPEISDEGIAEAIINLAPGEHIQAPIDDAAAAAAAGAIPLPPTPNSKDEIVATASTGQGTASRIAVKTSSAVPVRNVSNTGKSRSGSVPLPIELVYLEGTFQDGSMTFVLPGETSGPTTATGKTQYVLQCCAPGCMVKKGGKEGAFIARLDRVTGEILALKRHLGLVNVDDYQKATACRYIKESGNYTQVGLTVMNSVGEIVGTPMEKKIRV